MTEVTAILNVHREGILAHDSLSSMIRAKAAAEAEDVGVEILVVADCPDSVTRDYLRMARSLGARVLELDVDDLGLARNAAVAECTSRFVAFLDGDDLWGPQWLVLAHAAAMREPREVIWHPEANLYFGPVGASCWMIHPDMDDESGDWTALALHNLWTSLAFASPEIFLRVPYRATNLEAGLGYEDWSWNAETIAKGILHRPVPGTVHLLRIRQMSLARRTSAARALPIPSALFRSRLRRSTCPTANPGKAV
jgi:glycosyltransferase involved in cell wall biosynthesis